MRFTVTPLGSTGGRSVAAVVRDIVRYLQRPRPAVPTAGDAPAPGTGAYYTDAGEEPGRWVGNGATALGLAGKVDAEDFARLLAGRDPHTGARLIGARGSAGRRPSLGVGSATIDDGTHALYDLHDAAAALELDERDVADMVHAGQRVAAGHLVAALAGSPAPIEPPGSYLVPVAGPDGPLVPDHELERVAAARAELVDPAHVAAAGAVDDQLTLRDAARLAGVTPRYLRHLAAKGADPDAPAGAHLAAHRGTRGQWLVTRAELVRYLEERVAPPVRVGYDVTLTTEKSLGVLGLMAPAPIRREVLDAIEGANDTALAWLEQRAAITRVAGDTVPADGWAAGSFRHLTSRALDPFPHHHNVIANTVAAPDGRRRALDARHLYAHAQAASAIATVEVRHTLSQELGVRWARSAKGTWEIEGIPPQVLQEFSRRSGDIEAAVAQLEDAIGRMTTIEELRDVVTRTRPAKQQADARALLADWWGRAVGHGWTAEDLERCLHREPPAPEPPAALIHARLAGADGVCAGTSIFTRDEVLVALAELAVPTRQGLQPLLVTGERLEEIADGFLASRGVVELHPPTPQRRLGAEQRIYTLRTVLAVQDQIVRRFATGRSACAAVVPEPALAAALDAHPELIDEQAAFVRSICASGMRIQCAVGRPGAGKTTALRAAVDAWRRAGHDVRGAAVKGEAARLLGATAGVESETVAWYLAHRDPTTSGLRGGSVLLVDEASTLSDGDLAALVNLATTRGVTLRLIGDPHQHGAVAAGGMFRVLCERFPSLTPELEHNHRLADPADRAAAELLRAGRTTEALAALDAAGHLHVHDDQIDAQTDLLLQWWQQHTASDAHPMVDRSNRMRRHLNRLAHLLRHHSGELGDDALCASGGRIFRVGDDVVARRGSRALVSAHGAPLRNGATGTVTAIEHGSSGVDDVLVVDFTGAGPIRIPRRFFDDNGLEPDAGLDHAYALTSYAVQGATFATSASRIDDRTSRAEAYVDITRGRHANHVYVARVDDDTIDGERLPKAPLPPIETAVADRLRRSGPELTAWELDRGALTRDRGIEISPPGPP